MTTSSWRSSGCRLVSEAKHDDGEQEEVGRRERRRRCCRRARWGLDWPYSCLEYTLVVLRSRRYPTDIGRSGSRRLSFDLLLGKDCLPLKKRMSSPKKAISLFEIRPVFPTLSCPFAGFCFVSGFIKPYLNRKRACGVLFSSFILLLFSTRGVKKSRHKIGAAMPSLISYGKQGEGLHLSNRVHIKECDKLLLKL